ncbi:hypothetical protein ES703_94492 [subsurface metagenome]
MAEDKGTSRGIVVGGIGGTLVGTVLGWLLAGKPGEAAPPEERWNYLIQCQEAIIALLEQILAATGVAPPGVEITVKTPWVAKDPEQIYSHDIRVIGVFNSDMMVNWVEGKRMLIKVESTLNQACIIQVIGNFVDDMNLASDVNAPINVAANENHSIGLAWDDWHPFIGVRITTPVAPAAGILNIWAVIQE